MRFLTLDLPHRSNSGIAIAVRSHWHDRAFGDEVSGSCVWGLDLPKDPVKKLHFRKTLITTPRLDHPGQNVGIEQGLIGSK